MKLLPDELAAYLTATFDQDFAGAIDWIKQASEEERILVAKNILAVMEQQHDKADKDPRSWLAYITAKFAMVGYLSALLKAQE